MPEIYVIMAIPLKCVAVLFRMSPEGNTTLSAIKAYNGYQPCHKVLWINPAANITFSVIIPETAGFELSTPGTGGKSSNHSAVRLGKSLGQYPT